MNLSKDIESFLNACKEVEQRYGYYYEVVENCIKATTDYLHSLELDNLSYKERAKLTTQEKNNLKERREAKDLIESMEPLKLFIESQEGKRAHNLLTQVLGQTRKVEKYHDSRSYRKG